jgi:phosphatidate phosphatase APP1
MRRVTAGRRLLWPGRRRRAGHGFAAHSERPPAAVASTPATALATVEHLLHYSPPRDRAPTRVALLWVLRSCRPDELRQLACGTVERRFDRVLPPRPLLVFIIRVFRADGTLYADMMRLLAEERIGDLDLQSKCALIKSLQISKIRGGFGYDNTLTAFEAEHVLRLFESVSGAELTVLKNMLNEGGNRFNLHQLLFSAIPQPCRGAILSHFEAEAADVRLGTRPKPIKVLSDIDDTLFSSFLDKRYPKHIVYPGVRQFFAELTRDNASLSAAAAASHPTGVTPSSVDRGRGEVAAAITTATAVSEGLKDLHGRVASMVAQAEADAAARIAGVDISDERVDDDDDVANTKDAARQDKTTNSTNNTIRNLLFPSVSMAKWHEMWVHIEDRTEATWSKRFQREKSAATAAQKNDASEAEDALDLIVDLDVVVEENTVRGAPPEANDGSSPPGGAFEQGAALSPAQHAESHDTDLSDVTYITARPHGVRGVVAAVTRRRLRKAGVSSKPNVMLGDLTGLLGNKRIAQKKFHNFKEFSQLFPEYHFVLVGDSGQGDAALGALILADVGPEAFRGAFIHDISPDHGTTGDGAAKLDYATEQGFDFFRTYVGCAVRAHKDGLFPGSGGEGLLRVCQAVEAELRETTFRASARGRRQRVERWKDLLADIGRAREAFCESNE